MGRISREPQESVISSTARLRWQVSQLNSSISAYIYSEEVEKLKEIEACIEGFENEEYWAKLWEPIVCGREGVPEGKGGKFNGVFIIYNSSVKYEMAHEGHLRRH